MSTEPEKLPRRRRRRPLVASPLKAALIVTAAIGSGATAFADSPYAAQIITYTGAFGPSPYDDPTAVLGEPTSMAINSDPIIGADPYHVSVVNAAYNYDVNGNKAVTTLSRTGNSGAYTYGSITVKFDHPIVDNPANPYGVDLNVYGNSYYVGRGTASDSTDLANYQLAGGSFEEPVQISVSPDGSNWYTYTTGPFGDTAFPTEGYVYSESQFQQTGNGWTTQREDFTKPVNPTLRTVLGTAGLSANDAINTYVGSGGGTGIDLAASGFTSIQFVRVDATASGHTGEIDAFSIVRPTQVGGALSITPTNVSAGTKLYFQSVFDITKTGVLASFTRVSDLAKLSTSTLTDVTILADITGGNTLAAYELEVTSLIGSGNITFAADLGLQPGPNYTGDGSDLSVLQWNGSAWNSVPFTFDSNSGLADISGYTTATGYLAITEVPEPGALGLIVVGIITVARRNRRTVG